MRFLWNLKLSGVSQKRTSSPPSQYCLKEKAHNLAKAIAAAHTFLLKHPDAEMRQRNVAYCQSRPEAEQQRRDLETEAYEAHNLANAIAATHTFLLKHPDAEMRQRNVAYCQSRPEAEQQRRDLETEAYEAHNLAKAIAAAHTFLLKHPDAEMRQRNVAYCQSRPEAEQQRRDLETEAYELMKKDSVWCTVSLPGKQQQHRSMRSYFRSCWLA
ncbi:hypothetical protein Q9233_004391 [Columba guinea]|nr:hypothetical protein Q9233_004391 [Columba guinea]